MAGARSPRRAGRRRPRAPAAAVCPLSSCSRMWSLADSNADTANRHPAAPRRGNTSRWSQDVLDLDRHVEGHIGKGAVHGVDDPGGVVGAVEEIGIAEGDVARAGGDELGDIGHDGVVGHEAGSPVVDDGHRTMPATVRAAMARFDVPDQAALVPEGESGVAVETREGDDGPGARSGPVRARPRSACLRRGRAQVSRPGRRGRRPRRRAGARTRRRWRDRRPASPPSAPSSPAYRP